VHRRHLPSRNDGLRGENRRHIVSYGDSKTCQIFAHCVPSKYCILDHKVIVVVAALRQPERPPCREVSGLVNSTWGMIQECWGRTHEHDQLSRKCETFSSRYSTPTSEEIDDLRFLQWPTSTAARHCTHVCVLVLRNVISADNLTVFSIGKLSRTCRIKLQERVPLTLRSTVATVDTLTSRPTLTK